LRSKSADLLDAGRSFGESQWLLKVINFLLQTAKSDSDEEKKEQQLKSAND
jgi:hypothetical protein